MKIIHVVEAFGGGVTEFIYHLTNQLASYHHTIIYSQRELNIEDIKIQFPKNASFIEWPNAQREINPIKDVLACISLIKILKNIECVAIHLHSSKAGFLGRLSAPFIDCKNIIYTPNGAPFLRTDISYIKRKVFILFEKLANFIAGKVVCCSYSEYKVYKEININASYINNGVELTERPNINSTNKKLRIATSGRVTFQKNPHLFNEIALFFQDDQKIEFLWIGEGELRHILTSNNIKITGWLPKEKLKEELASIDLYLSTALWEGLPFVVLDAMNLSKPLLLHFCVGNVDLVISNYNGFIYKTLTEAVDQIVFLKNNPTKLLTFGDNSKMMSKERFNVKDMVLNYEKLYLSSKKVYTDV